MRSVLLEYAVALLLMLLQVLLFHGLTGMMTAWAPVALISTLLLLTLSASALLGGPSWRRGFLLCVTLLLTALLFSDLLFYRFFGRAIPLPALSGFAEAARMGATIREALRPSDLALLGAPILMLLLCYRAPVDQQRAKAAAALLLLAIGLGGTAGITRGSGLFDRSSLQRLYNDNRVLTTGGAVAYHLADLLKQLHPTSSTDLLAQAPRTARSSGTKLHGVAKGKNLLLIQLESTESFLIGRSVGGQVITPNLNAFQKEAISFPDFWPQVGNGNTSDAEFVALNSLHGEAAGSAYINRATNSYRSLAHALADAGYATHTFHAGLPTFYNRNEIYPRLGFQGLHLGEEFFEPEPVIFGGLADHLFFKQMVAYLEGARKPFFAFAITLSGHNPYEIPPAYRTLQLPDGEYDKLSRAYLQGQRYVDFALGQLFDELKRAGLWESTVIVLYGDHLAPGVSEAAIQRVTGLTAPFDGARLLELHRVPLMIHLPGGRAAGPRSVAGGQIDIFPTLINLLGLPHAGNLYLGQDLLNPVDDGLVAMRGWYPAGSFAGKGYIFRAAETGQLSQGECLDREARRLVDPTNCADGHAKALKELSLSDQILESDALPWLLRGTREQP